MHFFLLILTAPFLLAFTNADSIISAALTFEDLGITPRKLKGYPIEYLIQYRKGGPKYGSTVSEKMTSRSEFP